MQCANEWWWPYQGVPVVWRGRDLRTGVDCYRLVEIVLPKHFGRDVELAPSISPNESRGLVEARLHIEARKPHWQTVEWQEGAVCLWRVKSRPVHVGICLDWPHFLHADWVSKVVQLSSSEEARWLNKLEGCYLPP